MQAQQQASKTSWLQQAQDLDGPYQRPRASRCREATVQGLPDNAPANPNSCHYSLQALLEREQRMPVEIQVQALEQRMPAEPRVRIQVPVSALGLPLAVPQDPSPVEALISWALARTALPGEIESRNQPELPEQEFRTAVAEREVKRRNQREALLQASHILRALAASTGSYSSTSVRGLCSQRMIQSLTPASPPVQENPAQKTSRALNCRDRHPQAVCCQEVRVRRAPPSPQGDRNEAPPPRCTVLPQRTQ